MMSEKAKMLLQNLNGYLSSAKIWGLPSWVVLVSALVILIVIKALISRGRGKPQKQLGRYEGGLFREFKERLQYHVDNLFARGASAQFGLLLFATAVVTLIGMSAALFGLFGPANKGVTSINHDSTALWDSFWWSAKHIFDSGQVIGMYGSTTPVLLTSLFMSLASMVIFGLLISFISGMLSQRIEQLKSGSSTVKEKGHVLILGWNSKVIPIVQELAIGKPHMKVVIFSPLSVDAMRENLRAGGFLQSKIKVILRCGTPNNIGELKRVAFDKAYSIICLAPDSEDGKIAQNDIDVIKTLMLINSFKDWASGTRPKIVSEITQSQNVHIANVASGHRSPVVSSGAIVSRLVVQSSR
jgi:ion channel POLLUX/CASTOR